MPASSEYNGDSHLLEKPVHYGATEYNVDHQTPPKTVETSSTLFNINFLIIPFVFFFYFSTYCNIATTNNLLLEKVCRFHFNSSKEICDNLTNHQTLLNDVQKMVTNYGFYMNMMGTLPTIVVNILAGGWSDKYGRRPVLIIALFGTLIYETGLLLNSYYIYLPLGMLIIPSVAMGVLGGNAVINMCTYSFIGEKYPTQSTLVYAFSYVAISIANVVGVFVSGQLYFYSGYMGVYSTSLASRFLCFLYVIFVMKDVQSTKNVPAKILVQDFFSLKQFVENCRTFAKKRTNYGRAKIWLVTISNIIVHYGHLVPTLVMYLYTVKVFGWNVTKYSNFNATAHAVAIVTFLLLIPILTKVLKVRDTTIGIIGSLSTIAQNTLYGVSFQEWVLYASIGIGACNLFATAAALSLLSKLSDANELGKIFAVVASVEILADFGASLSTTVIYNAVIAIFPGIIFLVPAFICIFPTVVFMWMHCLKNKGSTEETSPPKGQRGRFTGDPK